MTWLYLAACFGVSLSISVLAIGEPIRKIFCFRSNPDRPHHACIFINCVACTGYWAGVFLGYVYHSPTGNPWLDGFVVIGVNLILYVVLVKLGLHEI